MGRSKWSYGRRIKSGDMTLKIEILEIAIAVTLTILLMACTEQTSEELADSDSPPAVETAVADAALVESPEMLRGKRVFASCASCHTVSKGAASTIGPNLSGVLGSTAGSKSDFVYSDALKSSGVVWTEESLDSYIANPASFIPGGTMAFVGVADKTDREAVLEYVIAKSSDDGTELAVPSEQGDDVATWE
jgi:cytochrome c